ncbi:CoA ester lyase [Mycolicibacterium aubagnense]|nr:CoA ester lyase [Mycolicibacterium aubagnense]TLH50089.1 CoA ester lyase [Mycolicibacterium aubagnense]WGI35349.1 CoA ester lyase [Mycolicibacterium aubagnense]
MKAPDLAAARSLLFVPGDRPERFTKAAGCGADQIILDLEDAVAPALKALARRHVRDWLAGGGAGIVRVNGFDTRWCTDDLAMVAEYGCPVMLPKADAETLRSLALDVPVIALIETARGVLGAAGVCRVPGVVRVAFGSIDLSAEIGTPPDDYVALNTARSALVLASAAAGLPAPIDGVTVDVRDTAAVRKDAVAAARLGFGGKLCVHPNQVSVVNEGFSPSDAQVAHARAVVAAAGAGGAGLLDGKMVDRPVLEHARRLLSRAERVASE